jgi:proteasome lid subunit RPN8/RPN11
MTPPPQASVVLSHRQWTTLISELGRRGGGHKEAGAFLLTSASTKSGPQHSSRVRRIVYYDELEADCLTGGISMTATAYERLWAVCAEQELTVIADFHTHPGLSVAQSPIDERNPMMATSGHLAFIVPHYATRRVAPNEVGAYEYQGRHAWRTITRTQDVIRLAGRVEAWDLVLEWMGRRRRRQPTRQLS